MDDKEFEERQLRLEQLREENRSKVDPEKERKKKLEKQLRFVLIEAEELQKKTLKMNFEGVEMDIELNTAFSIYLTMKS